MILSAILLNGCVCGAVMIPFRPDKSKESNKNGDIHFQELETMLPAQPTDLKEDTSVKDVNTDDLAELERDAAGLDTDTNKLTSLKQSYQTARLVGKKHDVTRDDFSEVKSDALDTTITRESEHEIGFSHPAKFLLQIFRFDLLANKLFLLFAVVEVCINISYMVPFTYSLHMTDVKFDQVGRNHLVWLSNAMSIANVVSRVPIGVLADLKIISNAKLMGILCLVTGFAAFIMPFCGFYWLLLIACVVYSASIGKLFFISVDYILIISTFEQVVKTSKKHKTDRKFVYVSI